jgi:small subunit ribosomal protein S16
MTAKDNEQRLVVNGERVAYWLGLGAQPTERVQKLLASLELMAPVKLREQPKKSAVGKKRAEREEEAAAAEAAAKEAAAAEAAAAAEEAVAEQAPAEEAAAEAPAEDEKPAE